MKVGICLLFVLVSGATYAQYTEYLQSDRPGQSNIPFAVGKKTVQVQTGYSYLNTESSSTFSNETQKESEILNATGIKTRFGITETIETFLTSAYGARNAMYSASDGRADFNTKTIDFVGAGVRANLFKGKGLVPAIGVDFQARIVDQSNTGEFDEFILSSVISLQSIITQRIALTANIISTDGDQLDFTLNLGYQTLSKISVFAEYYPTFYFGEEGGQFRADNSYFNAGFGYKLHHNWKIDLAGTWLLAEGFVSERATSSLDQFGLQAGVSFRFNWRHENES
jgi:hypothetical protein